MDKELQRLTATIRTKTADMEQEAYIELLRELANWAENEAGKLEFFAADAEDYDN